MINSALEGQDEIIAAELDRENIRHILAREKAVGYCHFVHFLMSLSSLQKINKFPRGRTGPVHLKIPREWKYYDAACEDPCVLYDSGRGEERLILISSPFMMKVTS